MTTAAASGTLQARRRGPDRLGGLVRLAATGDANAWNGLVEEFEGLLWAVARSHRLSHADAADVVQTTWLRLAENLGRIRDPARVGAWLATTARRECLRALHASARELPGADPPDLPDRETPPIDGDLIRSERDAAVQSALRRLPARDRSLLLMLVDDSGPSYAEIGAALRMPIGSVGPTRGRALDRLRSELERRDAITKLAA